MDGFNILHLDGAVSSHHSSPGRLTSLFGPHPFQLGASRPRRRLRQLQRQRSHHGSIPSCRIHTHLGPMVSPLGDSSSRRRPELWPAHWRYRGEAIGSGFSPLTGLYLGSAGWFLTGLGLGCCLFPEGVEFIVVDWGLFHCCDCVVASISRRLYLFLCLCRRQCRHAAVCFGGERVESFEGTSDSFGHGDGPGHVIIIC